ncbi:IS3 family transposase [Enterococcus faecalis]|nr:IS3 family transposase [Enterococcus faecalis]
MYLTTESSYQEVANLLKMNNILKQEVYYGKIYQSQNELREAIENYIYYYNHH